MGKKLMLKLNVKLLTICGLVVSVYVAMIITSIPAHAVDTSGFNAGRIIDDSVFANGKTMNPDQIQSFLNSKVSQCDTNGVQQSEYGGGTRAQYAASKGASTPFICLKDYSENGISAANIIYNASQEFSINPQVILVLLQKEQGLVTDSWPFPVQYRTATGYGCPDTAACDSQYFGLTNQIRWSARMFRAILDNSPSWYTPYILGNNYIQWSPNSSCGGSTVNIENRATQALYNYTPYRPNQAALNAGYGTGDSCSAYGNRNFYLYFLEWFGNTTGPDNYWRVQNINIFSDSNRTLPVRTNGNEIFLSPGQKAYVQVIGQNIGRTTWQQSNTRLGTFNPIDYSSPFSDNSWIAPYRIKNMSESTAGPYQTATFDFTITAPQYPSFYTERYNLVHEGSAWLNDANLRLYVTVMQPNQPPQTAPMLFGSGEILSKGNSVNSADGNSALSFSPNGNVELYTNLQRKWHTNTPNSGATKLVLQSDGNLVLYTSSGSAVWSSGTSLQDQTGLINRKVGNEGKMFIGQTLDTPDKSYKLNLQQDGNLVLYNPSSNAVWSSNTYGKSSSYITMQADGNLVLYDKNNTPLWSSRTSGKGLSDLFMQQDGNLVLYSAPSSVSWASNTYRK